MLKLKGFLFTCLFLILISCQKEKRTISNNKEIAKIVDEEKNKVQFNSKQSKIRLNSKARKTVENWDEYQNIALFMPKYYKTTTKEALFNSQRLAELTQQFKDTIRVKKFDQPSFRIRLNVLHNEAVRLADMDSINNITTQEIIKENKNIVNAFEAIKSKINSLVNEEVLNKDLEEFDYLFGLKDSLNEKEKKSKKIANPKFERRIAPLKKNQKDE